MDLVSSSSLTLLPMDLISLISDYIEGQDLYHVYLCGDRRLNCNLQRAVRHFSRNYFHERVLKYPTNFLPRFSSLTSLCLILIKSECNHGSNNIDIHVSHFPRSLTSLILDLPDHVLPFHPSDVFFDAIDLITSMLDLNEYLPTLKTLRFGSILGEGLRTSIDRNIDSSKLPRSLTHLDISHGTFYNSDVSNLPHGLIFLRISLLEAEVAPIEVARSINFPPSLTTLQLQVSSDNGPFTILSPQLTQLHLRSDASPLVTYLPSSLVDLTIESDSCEEDIVRLVFSLPDITRLKWYCEDRYFRHFCQLLPPTISTLGAHWDVLEYERIPETELPLLPRSVTKVLGFQNEGVLPEYCWHAIPSWLDTLNFETDKSWKTLYREALETRSTPNHHIQASQFQNLDRYTALLTHVRHQLRSLSFTDFLALPSLFEPLPYLTSLEVNFKWDSLLPEMILDSSWMPFCPSLTSLKTNLRFDLPSLFAAPFILKSLYISEYVCISSSVPEDEGAAIDWTSSPVTSGIGDFGISFTTYAAYTLYGINRSDFGPIWDRILSSLPQQLEQLSLRSYHGSWDWGKIISFPTFIFQYLPSSLKSLEVSPLATDYPTFNYEDLGRLPRKLLRLKLGRTSLQNDSYSVLHCLDRLFPHLLPPHLESLVVPVAPTAVRSQRSSLLPWLSMLQTYSEQAYPLISPSPEPSPMPSPRSSISWWASSPPSPSISSSSVDMDLDQ